LFVAFLLALALCQQTCPDCGLVTRKVRLCAPHAEEERLAFGELKRRLASPLESERIAALEDVALLTGRHANAPSEELARRLASGLQDEFPAVRARAASLLGPPQHALVCMEALLEALSAGERGLGKLLQKREDLLDEEIREYDAPERKKRQRTEALQQNEQALDELLTWRRAVIDQLASFPDDRVVAALCELARPVVAAPGQARKIKDIIDKVTALRHADQKLPYAMDVNVALVRLGSRAALSTVIKNLGVLGAELTEFEGLAGSPRIQQPALRLLIEARVRSVEGIEGILNERSRPLPEPLTLPGLEGVLSECLATAPEKLPGVTSPVW